MTVLEWMRSLGNAGAVANAAKLVAERRSERLVVEALADRLPQELPAANAA